MKKQPITERELNRNTILKDGDFKSIRDLLHRTATIYPNNKVLAELNETKDGIEYYTAAQVEEEIMNLGDGLIASGLKGAHIAIVSENSCRYVIADTCISSGVGIVTPIDKDAPVDLMVTLMTKSDINAVLCCAYCVDTIKKVQARCPLLKTIITIDKYKRVDGYQSYGDILVLGKSLGKDGEYRNMELDVNAPAKILFTSGTTGANKGVILTNANLAANVINCMDVIRATDGNTSMSVLPMHHATEINTHILVRLAGGRLTYINDSLRNMMNNIKIFKPNFITVVPMIAAAFYKAIWTNAEKAGKAEKLRKGIKISNFLRKFGVDKTHEMFKDVYAPFGGNLTDIVCGGSMLNEKVVRGMNDLGIRIQNGYGITECGPLVSMNNDTLHECLSVGKVCPELEAKLVNVDSDGVGELCIRGRSVSNGYYKDEEATKAVFDEEGFFNTGDSARIEKDGRIFLVGRKKNTIVLPSGKNVCPEEVENVISTQLDYVTDVVVYQCCYSKNGATCQNIIVAGLYIQDEEKRADREGIAADIRRINAILPNYKNIDFVEIPNVEYEKTSSRKIKRTALPLHCSDHGIRIF